MRAKTALLCFASIMAVPSYAGQAITGEAPLASAYNLTFYIEPNLAAGTTYCLTFTTTGLFKGYPRSGTFTDNAADFTGEWYENGDEVVLSAVYAPDGDSIPMVGRLLGAGNARVGGRFLDFFPSNTDAELTIGGTFFATRASTCPRDEVQAASRKIGAGGARAD